jgi:hypothetical protein
MRTFLIIRVIDKKNYDSDTEKALLNELSTYYGAKFNFRLKQISDGHNENWLPGTNPLSLTTVS